ncbi:hypothetical protein [Bordetella petrii]|uniref:hypothetical protein n=1 Tax=Bordetella petrii TaxID=94624 RepID=UPI000490505C|nr:hypothetical protein [Bordetella petrii]
MRKAFGKLKTRLATGIGSTVAVCTAALYTLLSGGPPPAVAQYQAGTPIEAGQWQVVPQRAWVSRDKKVHGVRLDDGEQALVLEADLSNRTSASTRDYSELLRLRPLPGVALEKPEVALVRDARVLPLLHPGLGERVVYVWKLPGAAAPPARLELDVIAKTFKPVDNLYGTPGWFNPKVVGQVSLPLEAPVDAGGAAEQAS